MQTKVLAVKIGASNIYAGIIDNFEKKFAIFDNKKKIKNLRNIIYIKDNKIIFGNRIFKNITKDIDFIYPYSIASFEDCIFDYPEIIENQFQYILEVFSDQFSDYKINGLFISLPSYFEHIHVKRLSFILKDFGMKLFFTKNFENAMKSIVLNSTVEQENELFLNINLGTYFEFNYYLKDGFNLIKYFDNKYFFENIGGDSIEKNILKTLYNKLLKNRKIPSEKYEEAKKLIFLQFYKKLDYLTADDINIEFKLDIKDNVVIEKDDKKLDESNFSVSISANELRNIFIDEFLKIKNSLKESFLENKKIFNNRKLNIVLFGKIFNNKVILNELNEFFALYFKEQEYSIEMRYEEENDPILDGILKSAEKANFNKRLPFNIVDKLDFYRPKFVFKTIIILIIYIFSIKSISTMTTKPKKKDKIDFVEVCSNKKKEKDFNFKPVKIEKKRVSAEKIIESIIKTDIKIKQKKIKKVKSDNKDYKHLYNRARYLLKIKKYESALNEYKKLRKLVKDDPEINANIFALTKLLERKNKENKKYSIKTVENIIKKIRKEKDKKQREKLLNSGIDICKETIKRTSDSTKKIKAQQYISKFILGTI